MAETSRKNYIGKSHIVNQDHCIEVVHQNIQCISNKINIIAIFLKDRSIDFLLVSEHWQNDEKLKFINFDGYNLSSFFCRKQFKHGGVAIFSKNKYKTNTVSYINNISKEGDFECCGIQVQDTNLIVVCIYRPPQGCQNIFLSQLDLVLQRCILHKKVCILGGDFNVNFDGSCPLRQRVLDLINSYGMFLTVGECTRVTNCSSTLIDNILVNECLNIIDKGIINNNMSDHLAQYVNVQISWVDSNVPQKKRLFSDENINTFCRYLRNENWQEIYSVQNVEDSFNSFLQIILYFFELSFPIKVVLNKSNFKSMLSPDALEAKNKVVFYGDLCKDFPQFKDDYKNAQREYQLLLMKYKHKQNDIKVSSSKNKNKILWNIVNTTLGKNKTSNLNDIVIKKDGKLICGKECADEFNCYFTSISKNITSKLSNETDFRYINSCLDSTVTDSISILPVDYNDIIKIIMSLKNSNSSGTDEISNVLLKKIGEYVAQPLAYLINLSLEQGIYPSALKNSYVMPLFKSGECENVANFRPITLCSSISKLFETVINSSLVCFMQKHNLLSPDQHGFVRDRGLDSALGHFVSNIVNTIDSRKVALGLFVDFTKAFDCINHRILLNKLERYGVRGVMLRWFESYLSGRTQQVKLNSFRSDKMSVDEGVPQGSILGPTLFIVYINDMLFHLKPYSDIMMAYADDTNFLCVADDLSEAETKANIIFERLMTWVPKNKLCINDSKTSCVVFRTSRSNLVVPTTIKLGENFFKYSDDSKLLGLTIDKNVCWENHIQNLCTKLTQVCYGISVAKNSCSSDILRQLYFGCFHSELP